jgi:hypothetical protein
MIRFCQRPPDHSRRKWPGPDSDGGHGDRGKSSRIGDRTHCRLRSAYRALALYISFSRGSGRPCHMVFLNPPRIRYEGRIGNRHVRYDGAQHSIGIVPAGANCSLQVHVSSCDVLALCVEPERYSAFALNAGVPTADIKEDLIDGDATMHHLCRALASSSDEPGSSGALLWEPLRNQFGRYVRHRSPAHGSLGSAALSRTLRYINDSLDGDVSIEANGRHRRPQPVPFQPDLRPRGGTFAASLRHARPRRAGCGASTRKFAVSCGDSFPNGLRRSEPHGAACPTAPRHLTQGAAAGRRI